MAYLKFALICIGYMALVSVLNTLIGIVTGFRFGWMIIGVVTGWIPIRVMKNIDKNIEKERQKEEAALKEYYKQEEEKKKTAGPQGLMEDFQKLPAWKRVELMKEMENQQQENQDNS